MQEKIQQYSDQGRIQDFIWGGGGGRKRICPRTHITSAKPKVPYGRGRSRARLWALEALAFFDAPRAV